MLSSSKYRDPKLVEHFNYIKWLKKANIFLEIKGYISYIDNSKLNLMSFRFLYYNNINITRNPKLAVKYIK